MSCSVDKITVPDNNVVDIACLGMPFINVTSGRLALESAGCERCFQLGIITVSMTWMMPLVARMSAVVTLAPSTLTPFDVSMVIAEP